MAIRPSFIATATGAFKSWLIPFWYAYWRYMGCFQAPSWLPIVSYLKRRNYLKTQDAEKHYASPSCIFLFLFFSSTHLSSSHWHLICIFPYNLKSINLFLFHSISRSEQGSTFLFSFFFFTMKMRSEDLWMNLQTECVKKSDFLSNFM